jgi:predicted transcriptional regulator
MDGSRGATMRIGKQELRDLIEDLPEEVEINEMLYRIYLRSELAEAEEDVRAGRVVTHEEVEAETARWLRGRR